MTASNRKSARFMLRAENASSRASRPAIGAASGVASPRHRKMPKAMRIAGTPTVKLWYSSTDNAQRSINSAMPGAPVGNIENNFCTTWDATLEYAE